MNQNERTGYIFHAGSTDAGRPVYRVDFVEAKVLMGTRFYSDAGWAEDASNQWVKEGSISEHGETSDPTAAPK